MSAYVHAFGVLLSPVQWPLVIQTGQYIHNGNACCVQDYSLLAFLSTKGTWTADV
jgi:hypothetical protein